MIGNYFKTREEAEIYKRKLIIGQQIKDIVLELNAGVKVNWGNDIQKKYYIQYDFNHNEFGMIESLFLRKATIYCLSDKFLETVLERIGEEDLKFYYGVEE